MIVYYFLLLLLPVYEYVYLPTVAGTFTLTKMVGLAAVAVGVIRAAVMPYPLYLFRWIESNLFCLLAIIASLSVVIGPSRYSLGSPLMSVLSILGYLIATLAFVDTMRRMVKVCYVILFSMLMASLSVYNAYFRHHMHRPGGVAGDSNYFALEALCVLPLAFTLWPLAGTKSRKVFLAASAALIIGAILLGASRGGFLGLCVCLVYVVLLSRHKVVGLAGTFVLVAILLLLLPESPLQRLLNPGTGESLSTRGRLEMIITGWNMISARPFTGIGLGQFKPLSTFYNPELAYPLIAHNTYVEVAAELGVPALLVFLLILWFAWRRLRRLRHTFRESGNMEACRIAMALEISLASAALAAIFISAEWVRHLWMVIFLGVALQRLLQLEQDKQQQVPFLDFRPAAAPGADAGHRRRPLKVRS